MTTVSSSVWQKWNPWSSSASVSLHHPIFRCKAPRLSRCTPSSSWSWVTSAGLDRPVAKMLGFVYHCFALANNPICIKLLCILLWQQLEPVSAVILCGGQSFAVAKHWQEQSATLREELQWPLLLAGQNFYKICMYRRILVCNSFLCSPPTLRVMKSRLNFNSPRDPMQWRRCDLTIRQAGSH